MCSQIVLSSLVLFAGLLAVGLARQVAAEECLSGRRR